MAIKEDDLVLCTVKRIEGTTVFVTLEGDGEGSIVMSEVAAGRIRNLREYVAPNKKIVCKILKIMNGHPQLSLRRVTAKERETVEERHKKEKTFTSLLKAIVKDADKVLEKIKEKFELGHFFDQVRTKPELLHEFLKKEHAQSLAKMIAEKEEREKKVRHIFILKSMNETGIEEIKEILNIPDATIKYLGSSQFSIEAKGKDFKEANLKVSALLQVIEQRTKEKKAQFELKEAK